MKIQCMIKREGPTTVQHAGIRYDFVANERGDYVCDVVNGGAATHFLSLMGGQLYRNYESKNPREDMMARYAAYQTKQEVAAAAQRDFDAVINRSLSLPNMKKLARELIDNHFKGEK